MVDQSRTLTASPIPDDERLLSAVEELTERIGGLTSRLVDTERVSTDTARWRRRATWWQRIAAAVLSIALVVVWGFDHRDNNRQARATLEGCQARNAGQAYTRGIDQRQTDAIGAIGAPPQILAPLQAAIDLAPPDRDCDGDGVLTTLDYPPEQVTDVVPRIATRYEP